MYAEILIYSKKIEGKALNGSYHKLITLEYSNNTFNIKSKHKDHLSSYIEGKRFLIPCDNSKAGKKATFALIMAHLSTFISEAVEYIYQNTKQLNISVELVPSDLKFESLATIENLDPNVPITPNMLHTSIKKYKRDVLNEMKPIIKQTLNIIAHPIKIDTHCTIHK